ncbi:hypothetical protein GCM10018793_21200 [Streptomyces sulfonofaciens]|uniref:Uncharacterized protein n=1 Tax=Streptomyces sulfonofaciens TaxID=68272 RepID=A0A919G2L9_9ACTN|nr:hypothetical protein [Streptomyces sulfonofaciens]GHH76080.1 hypothetical protein GCM10018793_21200 [Streptomyces sulfonofaciens]
MAHTEPGTMRRILHREMPATIALLADEEDFTAMRRYGTFVFDDHHTYLRQIEALLRSLAAEGRHTSIALFDPEEYEEYCTGTGLEPDTATSRTRFTAELAARGPTVPYEGQHLADLVPALVTAALRRATWEYATLLLASVGACAVCGEDIGWSSYSRACDLVVRVLDRAGPGAHHLVCSAVTPADTLLSALDITYDQEGRARIDESQIREFATVLATAVATGSTGGLVVRTTAEDTPDRVYGWRLTGWNLAPLTAAEVFDAYCTDTETGEIVAPESGVDYGPPPDLGEDGPPAGHSH